MWRNTSCGSEWSVTIPCDCGADGGRKRRLAGRTANTGLVGDTVRGTWARPTQTRYSIRYLIRRAHLVDLAVDVPRVLPRRSAVTEVMSAGIVGDYRDFDRTVASALSVTPQRRSLPRRASSCTTHPGLHTPKLKGVRSTLPSPLQVRHLGSLRAAFRRRHRLCRLAADDAEERTSVDVSVICKVRTSVCMIETTM